MKKRLLLFMAAVFIVLLLCGAAAAEEDPYVSVVLRKSVTPGESLDYDFGGFDPAEDQYLHVLRKEADGTYAPVTVIQAWNAATETSVKIIEANVLNELGDYLMTLGTEPDYTGIDEKIVAMTTFRVLEEKLATPVIKNVVHHGVVGTEVRGSVDFPEGTVMSYIEVGRLDDNGTFIVQYWDTFSSDFTVLGLYTTEPGTYQVRASAFSQWFGEPASDTVADSDQAVYEFVLADGVIPGCPAPVLSTTEADYDPEQFCTISYTIPGAEAVTCNYGIVNPATEEEEIGTGMPVSFTDGDTGSVLACDGAGVYHINCWGRFNGIWSTQGEAVFTLNPLGYLDIPTVIWQDSQVESELQVSGTDPLVFSVNCENAGMISCELFEKLFTGEYIWLDWAEYPVDDAGTAVVDLNDFGLQDGTYKLRFMAHQNGWLGRGLRTVFLTIGESSETASETAGQP